MQDTNIPSIDMSSSTDVTIVEKEAGLHVDCSGNDTQSKKTTESVHSKSSVYVYVDDQEPSSREVDQERQDAPPSLNTPWPLWRKLVLIAFVLVTVIALSVGLGLGLTLGRHKDAHMAHEEDGSSNASSSHGSGKLTVYWGAKGDVISLDDVCSDPSYDIVNLASLSYFFANGVYPRLAIAALSGPSDAQTKAGASALQDGKSLIPALSKCQENGKRVFLSMGGAESYADVHLSSDDEGKDVADKVWDLFLGGSGKEAIRPFGDVILDGIDFDNESGMSTGYVAMANRFRHHFASDSRKQYYLSAAPQCPMPTDKEFFKLYKGMDYVWVQFYNNDVCNIGRSHFYHSIQQWSKAVGNSTSLMMGALASEADGDKGFVSASEISTVLSRIRGMDLPNFSGIMLWEAQLAAEQDNYQKQIEVYL